MVQELLEKLNEKTTCDTNPTIAAISHHDVGCTSCEINDDGNVKSLLRCIAWCHTVWSGESQQCFLFCHMALGRLTAPLICNSYLYILSLNLMLEFLFNLLSSDFLSQFVLQCAIICQFIPIWKTIFKLEWGIKLYALYSWLVTLFIGVCIWETWGFMLKGNKLGLKLQEMFDKMSKNSQSSVSKRPGWEKKFQYGSVFSSK